MIKQVLNMMRARCHAVYLVGEHGTATFYAVCEFINMHHLLIFFSLVLLLGLVLVGVDRLLTLAGM
jgi:hypothetical protein